MSNIRTLIQNREKVFGKISEAEMKNQIKALHYIELLAMQTKTSVSDWDVLNAFRAKEGSNKIVTNPKEINKRMFALADKAKINMQTTHVRDVLKHEKRILKLVKTELNTYVTSLTHSIRNSTNELNLYKERIENNNSDKEMSQYDEQYIATAQKIMADRKKSIISLQDSLNKVKELQESDRLVKDIAKIVMGGFWRFLNVSTNNLVFITANNVILFDKNPKAALNLQKDMGVYKVKLNLSRMECTVHAFYGNTKSGDCLHPYVNQGDICFGNSGTYFNQAADKEFDIVKMMNILSIVLSTYSSANGPYRRLSDFRLEPNVPTTKEAERYLAKKTPQEDRRLVELMQAISVKDVANKLAKSIGSTRIEDPSENDEDEDDDYDEEE